MEEIKINKTYFKLEGESNFPPKNPTPSRNKVYNRYDPNSDYRSLSYEEFKKAQEEGARKHAEREFEREMSKLSNIANAITRGDYNNDPIRREEAQNYVTRFKKRWYK